MFYILLGAVSLTMVANVTFGIRNIQVRNFRLRLIDEFTGAWQTDMLHQGSNVESDNYFWRSMQYNSISHGRMLFTFWRKLTPENYYADTSFLRPSEAALEDPAVGF